MQAGSRKAHGKATFDAMCLVVEVLQQAENSGGLDLAVSPDPEEPDLQISEDVPSVVVTALLCLGGECGYRLSHANSTLWLQSGLQGADAAWRIMPASQEQTLAITCLRQGEDLFLSHFDGVVSLALNSCNLCSSQWYVEKHLDGYTISCYSRGLWMYLSHACSRVFLQTAYRGAGELWQLLTELPGRSSS